jgi:hypothetical protein
MEATPFEQLDDELATYLTGAATVAPRDGLDTFTAEKESETNASNNSGKQGIRGGIHIATFSSNSLGFGRHCATVK